MVFSGADARQTTYGYDALGRTASRNDREVDAAGTPIAGRDAGTMTSAWNDAGWISSHAGRGGNGAIAYQYDAAGHETYQSDSTAATSTTRTFHLNGWVRSELDVVPGQTPKGAGYRYYGDGAEYTRGLYASAAVPGVPDVFSATAVGDAGEVSATLAYGWGHTLSTWWAHDYDRAGRQISTVDPAGRRTEQSFNPQGTVSSVTHRTAGAGSAVLAGWGYEYDAANRITDVTRQASGATLAPWSYDYNNVGRLIEWDDGAAVQTFDYDPDGNRLETPDAEYTYRPDGSIATTTPSGGSAKTFTYAPAGGLVTDGCNTSTFDGLDRLATTAPNLGTCTGATNGYTYLPDNRQASRTNGTVVTRNRWAAGALFSEETAVAANTSLYLVSGLGTHAVTNGGTGAVQHLKTDGHGNTALLTRPSGTVTVCGTSYDPWGNQAALGTVAACAPSNTVNNIWYRGAAEDPATGTYRWGNRSYNPATGTWLSPDTYQAPEAANDLSIGTDPLTSNRYSYVNGDPINGSDPSGHIPIDCLDGPCHRAGGNWLLGNEPSPAAPARTLDEVIAVAVIDHLTKIAGDICVQELLTRALIFDQHGLMVDAGGSSDCWTALLAVEQNVELQAQFLAMLDAAFEGVLTPLTDITGVSDLLSCIDDPEISSCGATAAAGLPITSLRKLNALRDLLRAPSGLRGASQGLSSVFEAGTARGRSIIDIRAGLLDDGFTQTLTNNRSGYLFRNSLGEEVRIMSRNGGWDIRIQNQFGNYLDEFGNVANPAATHDIPVHSR